MSYAQLVSTIIQGTVHDTGNSPAIDTTGADLLVAIVCDDSTNTATLSDSNSNTWTFLTAHANGTNRVRIAYCQGAAVGAGHTFKLTGTSSQPSLSVAAFSGSAASPLDQQNGANDPNNSQLQTGSVTPGQDNELLVFGLGQHSPTSAHAATVDVGTILQQASYNSGVSFGNVLAYQIQTTATARNPNFSWVSPAGCVACIATFKAAGAASFVPYTPWPQLGPTLAQ